MREKKLKNVLTSVVLVTISSVLLYFNYQTIDDLIGWNNVSELRNTQIIEKFALDSLNKWEVSLPLYYVFEYYLPKQIPRYEWLNYFVACTFIIGTMGTLYYTLKISNKYSFILFITVLIAWTLSLNVENIIGTARNGAFLILFMPIAITGYCIQTFSSFQRKSLLIWSTLTVILILLLVYFGQIDHANIVSVIINPFYFYLTLSIGFIFLLSNTVFEFLVQTISSSTSAKGISYWKKIVVVFLIYLSNVVILYAQEAKFIEVQQRVFTPITLVVISLLINIWSLKSWKNNTKLLFWSTLMIMATLQIYMTLYVHEAFQEFIAEYITIAYMLVPTAYLIYLLLNFYPIINQGLPVHKVIHKPVNVSWLLPQVGAGFAIIFFLSFKNGYSVNQIIATKNSLMADFYLEKKEENIAETFLKTSIAYDLYNHRANYVLGGLADKYGDKSASIYYYKKAIQKYHTAHSYIALAQVLENENLFFDALFDLSKGNTFNTTSNQLATYQAKLYDKINNQDSTYIYLQKASKICSSCEIEQMNDVSFWVKNGTEKKKKNLIKDIRNLDLSKSHPNLSAITVLSGSIHTKENDFILKSEVLSVLDFAILFNRISNRNDLYKLSPEKMKSIVENPLNEQFASELMFIEAINLYKYGKKTDAISKLVQLNTLAKEKTNIHGNVAFGLLFEEAAFEVIKEKLGTYIPEEKQKWLIEPAIVEVFRKKNKEKYENLKNIHERKEINIDSLYQQAPYNTDWIIYLVNKSEKEYGKERAYRFLVSTLENNPHESLLWKLYVEKSIEMNLLTYAEDGIYELEKLGAETDFVKETKKTIKFIKESNTFK